MFKLGGKKCGCHGQHMTFEKILKHGKLDIEEVWTKLFNLDVQGQLMKAGKKKNSILRRENQRLIGRILDVANSMMTAKPTQVNS